MIFISEATLRRILGQYVPPVSVRRTPAQKFEEMIAVILEEGSTFTNKEMLEFFGVLNAEIADQLAAERFAIWLVLAPILGELAELNRDNDDGHITGYEITLFQRRMQAALEAIGQGLHRFEEPTA